MSEVLEACGHVVPKPVQDLEDNDQMESLSKRQGGRKRGKIGLGSSPALRAKVWGIVAAFLLVGSYLLACAENAACGWVPECRESGR